MVDDGGGGQNSDRAECVVDDLEECRAHVEVSAAAAGQDEQAEQVMPIKPTMPKTIIRPEATPGGSKRRLTPSIRTKAPTASKSGLGSGTEDFGTVVAPGPGGGGGSARARTAAISPRVRPATSVSMCAASASRARLPDRTATTSTTRTVQRDAQHGGEFAAVVGQGCPVAVAVVAHDAALTLLQWASVQHVALEEEAMVGPHPAGLATPRLEPRVATPAMTSPAIGSAHHHPKRLLTSRPAKSTADRYVQSRVCLESATTDRGPVPGRFAVAPRTGRA